MRFPRKFMPRPRHQRIEDVPFLARWYFPLIAVAFALSSSVLNKLIGAWGAVGVSFGTIIFGCIYFCFHLSDRRVFLKWFIFVGLMAPLVCINTLVSTETYETLARWILWLMLAGSMYSLASMMNFPLRTRIIAWLPWMLTLIYTFIMIGAVFFPIEEKRAAAFHLSGLYATLILSCGLFTRGLLLKCLWCGIGILGVYFSGSRGALFALPIAFIPYIIYTLFKNPSRFFLVAVPILALFAVVVTNEKFLEAVVGQKVKERADVTGIEHTQKSLEGRMALVQYGWDLFKLKPEGFGMGNTYRIPLTEDSYLTHCHNGTVSLLVEFGWPIFPVYAIGLSYLLIRIYRRRDISSHDKAFYFTYFAAIFSRSLSENYSPMDLGNFFNQVFLFMTCYYAFFAKDAHLFMPARRLPPPGAMRHRPLPRPRPVA